MAVITPGINFLQASFSAYNLYLASIAIRNLLQYEEKAKKAAKWSDTAAQELWKTRSTQASNAVSVSISLGHFLILRKIILSFFLRGLVEYYIIYMVKFD